MTPEQQKEFLCGYAVCAVWSSTGDDGEPLDSTHDESDLAGETLQAMKNSCAKFISENENDLAEYVERRAIPRGADCSGADWAGHDFWLTRNGHGTGFWDRGFGELGDRLSEASKAFGEAHLYVGDDGKLYLFEG
tara:strand:+ start:375 stop:779 length:405 start_codon:yes stop_codon:yes gene_type:complete